MAYIPIIARVNSLPPLPESIIKLEQLYIQGEPDIDAIVKIIESDPSLTADLLAKVNAPLYSFSRQIISILQAVTLFGSAKIRAMVLSSTIDRNFDINMTPYGITTAEFSKVSMLQSELMFQWYMGINVDLAKLLTPIAFLMETGKILIAKEIIEKGKTDQFLADLQSYERIGYVENIHVAMTTAQINALIFDHWNLNKNFTDCMRYLDDEYDVPSEYTNMVHALQVVRSAVNVKTQLCDEGMHLALERAEKNGLDSTKLEKVMKRIKEKI